MRKSIIAIFLCLLFFVPCRDAAGILVNLAEKDVEDAVKTGEKQGANVIKYLKQRYRFGEENVFDGIDESLQRASVIIGFASEVKKDSTE